ncbi:hypothetical protein B0T10DRAFT_474552 [Thelonectria olida]|uniref:Uncharacterized protein n=1 Tax=Thelonectria olida TaxID=1576542 RepID=A0A9P9AWS2_9HYPO|nr:hypothetical protein B0T10DRAFT_474552 [Thelonectria olida]
MLLKLLLLVFVALVLAKDGGPDPKDIVRHLDAVESEASQSAQIMSGVGTIAEKIAVYWKHKPLTKAENIMVDNAHAIQATIDLIYAAKDKLSDDDQKKLCNAYQDAMGAEQKMLGEIIEKDTVLQTMPNRLTLLFDIKEVWKSIGQLTAALLSKASSCEGDVKAMEEAVDKLMLDAINALVGKHIGKLDD